MFVFLFFLFFITISFNNDDILGLIKMVCSAVRLEEADHLIDTLQGGEEVSARLVPVACRARRWVVEMNKWG